MIDHRPSVWPLATIILGAAFLPSCAPSTIERRAQNETTPLVFTPDQNWDGIDGQWNSFSLRVGTPQQVVRVFASTASQQTWVVQPGGCAYTSEENYDSCASLRGWTFNISESSSWDTIGNYSLHVEQNLGYTGAAEYGYDTVGLGNVGDGGPTISNTTVGAFMGLDFFLGVFGLHPKSTNFTSFNEQSPSYMTKLKDQGLIPSLSYGYTAGNQYRLNTVLASLTLGGYDSSKFTPNNISFSFAPDNERDLVVNLQGITMDSSTKSSVDLLPDPVTMYIDSTVPQIWLPVEACEQFEDAFGLTYDNDTDLYLVNDTLHDTLVAEDANVTFTLGTSSKGGQTVDIVLPYAAFDLTAQSPYQGLQNSTNYFPIRRGLNESQYVFGRTFLQEAYIIVDHERSNFSVSQCVFDSNSSQTLVVVRSTDYVDESSTSAPKKPLNTAAIAGLAVGLVILVLAIGALIGLFYFRRRYQKLKKQLEPAKPASPNLETSPSSTRAGDEAVNPTLVIPKAELDATTARSDENLLKPPVSALAVPLSPHSPSQPSPISEVEADDQQIYEMPGDFPQLSEADGRQLSEKQAMLYREAKYNGTNLEPPPTTTTSPERNRPTLVNPTDVKRVIHAGDVLVSPLMEREDDDRVYSPLSPLEGVIGTQAHPQRQRFSFEEE